jgi:hypothetical protein
MTTLNSFSEIDPVEFEINEEAARDWAEAEHKVQHAWASPLPTKGGTLTQPVVNDDFGF